MDILPTHHTEKDATHYNMSHRRRGKAFIFNHMHFDPVQQLKARNGTDADRDNLRVCLRQLDFEVEVYNDLPVKEIDRVLENAALEDHSDADCVLVAGEERISKYANLLGNSNEPSLQSCPMGSWGSSMERTLPTNQIGFGVTSPPTSEIFFLKFQVDESKV